MIKCEFENGNKASLRHVTADAIVLDKEQRKILLVKRSEDTLLFPGKYSMPGGFVNRDENLEQAVLREIKEETGCECETKELFRIIDNPDRRGEDRQNVGFVFIVTAKSEIGEHDDEVQNVQWFDLNEVPNQEQMSFDHLETLEMYKKYKKEGGKLPLIG